MNEVIRRRKEVIHVKRESLTVIAADVAMAVIGPAALLRHNAEGRSPDVDRASVSSIGLELQDEGLTVLRRAARCGSVT